MDSVPRTRVRPSAAGQLHEFLRVPFAPHLECSGDGVYFLDVLGAELEGKRSQVVFEPFPFSRARDRNDPRFLRQQPSERDLRRGGPLSRGDGGQAIDQRAVGFARVFGEPRNAAAEVGGVECSSLVDLACEKSLAEWAEGYEADPQFLEHRHDIMLWLPRP